MSAAPAARETIFALSSGAPPAAIAVVRLSGPASADALRALTGRLPSPRRATLATLRDAGGEPLDRALVLWLPGPATATGEDMAELHLHGGRAVIAAVLAALDALPGLATAEPGAFTRRAFANGRLDLAEAEGLADLLAAETEGQRRQALRLVEGGLGRLIEGWLGRLLALAAHVEAAIEFGEEEIDVPALGPAERAALARLRGEVGEALARPPAERLRDGPRVLVAGPVNAGKSSLINVLAGRDAAIVTDVAGTTRDLVEVPVLLDGVACLLIDSAGLRDSDDPVERIGIARARAAAETADLILWLGAPADAPVAGTDAPIVVHARADLPERRATPDGCDVAVSVRTGKGLAALRSLIARRLRALLPPPDTVALHRRHRALVAATAAALDEAAATTDAVLVAEHLRTARAALDRVTGRAGVEDMLDAVFARFCIGK